MPWYYADNGKQTGPFTDDEFQSLLAAGTVRAETLVWRDGMANWMPYGQTAPASAPASAAPPIVGEAAAAAGVSSAGAAAFPGAVICSECGQSFPPDQVIRIADRNVCAVCKPRLVQRLTEGAAPTGVGGEMLTEEQLLQRDYRVDIGACLDRGWKLFSANTGPILGVTVLVGLVFLGCYLVTMVVSFVIPFGNVLLQALYIGPLTGGYIWYFLKLLRGEPATLGDAFAGFSRRFGQLFLASLVQTLLSFACFIPAGIIALMGGISMGAMRGFRFNQGMGVGLIVGIAVTGLLGVVVVFYLTTLWTHSIPLIIDKGMNFWPAMQLSRKMVAKSWGMTFLFVLVAGIISGSGAILCGIGLIVTVPLYFAMKAHFYDDNFRDLRPASM